MELNIFMVIQSHLSDAENLMESNPALAKFHIEFSKALIQILNRRVNFEISEAELSEISVKLFNRFK
jgi:hypothetical protein